MFYDGFSLILELIHYTSFGFSSHCIPKTALPSFLLRKKTAVRLGSLLFVPKSAFEQALGLLVPIS